ncbi:hypothetical protein SRRS_25930 [Sporomusa rhizae]
MVVTFSWRGALKKSRLVVKIVLLTLILFYILPKLVTLFWQFNSPGLKIRDQHLLEKPLRVMAASNMADHFSNDIDYQAFTKKH